MQTMHCNLAERGLPSADMASTSQTLRTPSDTSRARHGIPPIVAWACLGLAVVAFELFVLGRWVTGANFQRVPAGPDHAPRWMTTTFVVWQAAGILAAAGALWLCVIRPWRREGRLSTDGLLVIAFATLWFQDPLSAYFGHWFTYNTNLVNFGSWVSDVPGWHSFGKPGAMIAEPILLIGPVYVYFILIATLLGCWMMRTVQRKWPQARTWQVVASCFLLMCVVDIVGEGLVWLPLGFWEYPGGWGPKLFAGTYHQFPLNEMLTIATIFTGISCLRYFKDDRGRTVVERGVERVAGGSRIGFLRTFAVLGAVHLILFVGYNLPNGLVGASGQAWPKDLVNRSYLRDGLCGPGTVNQCPTREHGFIEGGK